MFHHLQHPPNHRHLEQNVIGKGLEPKIDEVNRRSTKLTPRTALIFYAHLNPAKSGRFFEPFQRLPKNKARSYWKRGVLLLETRRAVLTTKHEEMRRETLQKLGEKSKRTKLAASFSKKINFLPYSFVSTRKKSNFVVATRN